MTPEKEKKKQQGNIVPLHRDSDTTVDEKKSVTVKDPTTTIEQKQSWMVNPDGTPNQPLIDLYNQRTTENLRTYHIDPNTNTVDRDSLFGAIGIRPQDTKEQREREIERNRKRQKASALFQSAALISDIISAAHGGNAWKREKDNTAAQAQAANDALHREQLAEDAANAGVVQKYLQDFHKAQDALHKQMEHYNYVIRKQSGGGSTTTTTGGNTHTRGTVQQQLRNGSGPDSGSGYGKSMTKTIMMQVKNPDGTIGSEAFHIPANDFDALGRYLSAAYSNLTTEGKNNIDAVLASHYIFPRDIGNGKKNTYDGADLLSSGIIFDDPQVRNEFIRIIENDNTRSKEEIDRIKRDLNYYASNVSVNTPIEEKRSFLQRVKDWFKKDESGKQWQGVQENEGEEYDDD